tara:strand:+ start:18709 stop:19545 length:837 start_codon:yes stop_codon:yes gene_type:complete
MSKQIYEVELIGGLCNKLFCLFSACDIAIKYKIKILEPFFDKTLFGEIYDLDYFNNNMKKLNNEENIIIPYKDKNKYNISKIYTCLWVYSEHILKEQRINNIMNYNCMNIQVLQNLKLNKDNLEIVDKYININTKNGLHIRIESDWIVTSFLKIDINKLINMYKLKWNNEDVFFTTGENQKNVAEKFTNNNINSVYCFDNNKAYIINAAINFELCCRTKIFVGLTQSTFSNLITLKRYLTNINNSFIYNYNDEIILRKDKGLQPLAINAINNNVLIEQ